MIDSEIDPLLPFYDERKDVVNKLKENRLQAIRVRDAAEDISRHQHWDRVVVEIVRDISKVKSSPDWRP